MRKPRRSLGYLVCISALLAAGVTPTVSASAAATGPSPGDVLVVGGLGVIVPQRGHMVELFTDFVDGTGQQLVVETTEDGVVLINPVEVGVSSDVSRVDVLLGATGECSDDFVLADTAVGWTGPMDWWFNSPSTPDYLTVSATVDDLRAGTTNITHENNNCGRPDRLSASANYQGTNSNGVNISVDNMCLSEDGVSEVSFGTLPNNIYATTCNWHVVGLAPHRTESDIKFNKQDHTWTTGYCGGQFSTAEYVEGVMTHERGHTWNAKDFPTGHPNQTMGGAASNCPGPDEKQTLGLGDMLTLESRY